MAKWIIRHMRCRYLDYIFLGGTHQTSSDVGLYVWNSVWETVCQALLLRKHMVPAKATM